MVKKIVNLILVVALLLNLALLFLPYWSCDDGAVSIGSYVILPQNYKSLTKQFQNITGERKLLTNVALPLFVLILVDILGAVLGLLMLKSRVAGIFCVITGLATGFVFITDEIVKDGRLWIPVMIAACLTFLAGVVQLVFFNRYAPDEN